MPGLLTYHIDTGGGVARSQIQINTNKEAIRGVINDLILCEKNNKIKSVYIK